MIGIIILGLGMVMVATLFPVAWGRARTLSEFTFKSTMVENAHATVKALARVAGPDPNAAGFAGDLVYLPAANSLLATNPLNWPNDTWVHAWNLQNIQVENQGFVDEDPWLIEAAADPTAAGLTDSYADYRIDFHQRVYPPMRRRSGVDDDGEFNDPDDPWDEELATRRFCVAVLHRRTTEVPIALNPVTFAIDPASASAAAARTRTFDMFYVTLRRPQPTARYARQDAAGAPNPYVFDPSTPAKPQALASESDVMFPVAWRVQLQFPQTSVHRFDLAGNPLTSTDPNAPTGIPTEVTVPPSGLPGTAEEKAMIVDMFPSGARFIDEISGMVFQVVRRRITSLEGDSAVLTLDREVTLDDLDLPSGDARCPSCAAFDPNDPNPVADDAELLRTVWVFPPPVEPQERSVGQPLFFAGGQPVIDIDIRTLAIGPTQ